MVIALAGGSIIFISVVIVFGIGVVIALYTRRGSGMDQHPYKHVYGGAPGADAPAEGFGGSDRTSVTEREVARKWRNQERPPLAPPEERASERDQEQRPGPSKKPPIRRPL